MMQADTCKILNFTVGILKPDWLAGAKYLGFETVNGILCYKWTEADFIDYWADIERGYPVKWKFLWDGATLDFTSFTPNSTVSDDSYWQAPASCFKSERTAPS